MSKPCPHAHSTYEPRQSSKHQGLGPACTDSLARPPSTARRTSRTCWGRSHEFAAQRRHQIRGCFSVGQSRALRKSFESTRHKRRECRLTYSSHDELDAVHVLHFAACTRAWWSVCPVDGDIHVAAKRAHFHVPIARADRPKHRLQSANVLPGFFRCAERKSVRYWASQPQRPTSYQVR